MAAQQRTLRSESYANGVLPGLWPELDAGSPVRSPSADGAHDAAVVVGIEDYAIVGDIPGARKNALAWYAYLVRQRGVPVDRVDLLLDERATREDIEHALGKAARAVGRDGTVWFVFIGHGAPWPGSDDGLLVGFDAQARQNSLLARGVSRNELLARLERSEASEIRILLDACFSGRTSSGAELVSGLQPVVVDSRAPTTDGRTVLLTAARSDQFAGPLPGLGRPAFSYLALAALHGWGDANRDRLVTSGEVLGYTDRTLRTLLEDRTQSPELVGSRDAVLGRSLGESGPDLSTIVARLSMERATRAGPTFTLSRPIGPDAVAERPPPFDPDSLSLDFRRVDVEALRAYDDVVAFDASPESASAKAERWRELARRHGEFAAVAGDRELAWRAVHDAQVAAVRRADAWRAAMEADWKNLEVLLGLAVVSEEDKRAWSSAFMEGYGELAAERPHMIRAMAPWIGRGQLPPSYGSLVVRSNVGGDEVAIDGERVGASGPQEIPLPAGSHTVAVRKSGYAEASRSFTIEPGATETLWFELAEKSAWLIVETGIGDARIYIDGHLERKRSSPGRNRIAVTPGRHEIVVRKDGCAAATGVIEAKAGAEHAVLVALVDEARPRLPNPTFSRKLQTILDSAEDDFWEVRVAGRSNGKVSAYDASVDACENLVGAGDSKSAIVFDKRGEAWSYACSMSFGPGAWDDLYFDRAVSAVESTLGCGWGGRAEIVGVGGASNIDRRWIAFNDAEQLRISVDLRRRQGGGRQLFVTLLRDPL